MLSLLVPPLSGCTTTPPVHDFCYEAYPIFLSSDEHLDNENAGKVQAMDLFGKDQCGWKIKEN